MTTNAEDRSEIGAADPLGVVIERVLTEAYSKAADEKMTLEAGTVSCLVNELKTLRFIQAAANAELRQEVAGLRAAINRMAWRMDKRAADAFKSGAVNISKLYEACADIVSEELKGVKP
jgi:hypothetical protein